MLSSDTAVDMESLNNLQFSTMLRPADMKKILLSHNQFVEKINQFEASANK